MNKLILASKSASRFTILNRAGVDCDVVASHFNEREFENNLALHTPEDHAAFLAISKAQDVSKRYPNDYILGADQLLICNNTIIHKAENLEKLRDKLDHLRGKTHNLISALALVKGETILWKFTDQAEMSMRNFDDKFLDIYIEKYGQQVLPSVGGYHYEGAGLQLFEKIVGDYYTILGLPILPLLSQLRKIGLLI